MIFAIQIFFMIMFAVGPERIIPNNIWGILFWLWMGTLILAMLITNVNTNVGKQREEDEHKKEINKFADEEVRRLSEKPAYINYICRKYNINYDNIIIEDIVIDYDNWKVKIKIKGKMEGGDNDVLNDLDEENNTINEEYL